MKLKLEDKLKIIKLYLKNYSVPQLCKKFKVEKTTIKRIERQYREHGIESFKQKTKNRKHTAEFKFEIVNRVLNGESKNGIATELCLNSGMIFSWVKKYQELGYNGLTTKKNGRPKKMKQNSKTTNTKKDELLLDDKDKRIKELEERNAELEMENDLLKKLRALVQQRTQPQKKKK